MLDPCVMQRACEDDGNGPDAAAKRWRSETEDAHNLVVVMDSRTDDVVEDPHAKQGSCDTPNGGRYHMCDWRRDLD